MTIKPSELADITDCAELLGVTVDTMRAHLRDRDTSPRMAGFPIPIRYVGQSPVWDRSEIEAWLMEKS